jgi:PAS domain-containing protein
LTPPGESLFGLKCVGWLESGKVFMGPNHASAAEGGFTEESGQDRLWFLEGMDRVNQAIQDTDDLRQTNHVSIPCCPFSGAIEPGSRIPAIQTARRCERWLAVGVPALAHSAQIGVDVPMEAAMASVLQVVSASEGPVCFDGNQRRDHHTAALRHSASDLNSVWQSIRRSTSPICWAWTSVPTRETGPSRNRRLFEAIGRRIATLLTSLSLSRDLQESKARLEEAQRVAHVGYWDWNLETGEIIWSDEAYRIFGLQTARTSNGYRTVSGLVHPDDREELYSTVDVEVAGGVHPVHQHRIVRPNGEVRTVQSITSKLWSAMPGDPESGASGSLTGYLAPFKTLQN